MPPTRSRPRIDTHAARYETWQVDGEYGSRVTATEVGSRPTVKKKVQDKADTGDDDDDDDHILGPFAVPVSCCPAPTVPVSCGPAPTWRWRKRCIRKMGLARLHRSVTWMCRTRWMKWMLRKTIVRVSRRSGGLRNKGGLDGKGISQTRSTTIGSA